MTLCFLSPLQKQVPGAGSSIFIMFSVSVTEHGTGRGYWMFILCYLPSSLQKRVHGAGTKMFTTNIGLDNYYLEYEVKVGAYNDLGSGPNSTDTIVMSAEGSMYCFEYNFNVWPFLIVYLVSLLLMNVICVCKSFMFRFFWTRSDGRQTQCYIIIINLYVFLCGLEFFLPT